MWLLKFCLSMAYVINDKLECFIFFLFALSYVLGHRFVDGRRIATLENND